MRKGLYALAILGAVACDGGEGGLVVTPGKIAVDPSSVDFGRVQTGARKEARLIVSNVGDGVLGLKRVALASSSTITFGFECGASPCDGQNVPPSGSIFVNLRFTPTTVGPHVDTLSLTTDRDETVEVPLRGEGATAALRVEPVAVSFGNVVVDTSKTISVRVTNTSEIEADVAYLAGPNIGFCGGAAEDNARFCISPTNRPFSTRSRFHLGPGEATNLTLQFRPTTPDARETASFALEACEGCGEIAVAIDGFGIAQAFVCDPPAIDFGPVNPRACVGRSVRCTNVANEIITVVDWGPNDDANANPDFRFPPFTQAQSLEEGESIELRVEYCPSDLAADQESLAIETDNTDPARRVVRVPLAGRGGGPDIEVLPTGLSFGQVAMGAPSRRVVSILNVGVAELEVTQIELDAGSTAFSADTAGRIIPVMGSYELVVSFDPSAVGPAMGELRIRSNDQDEPVVVVRLIGEGVQLPPCQYQIVPPMLGFGVVERGRVASRGFEIRNTGTADCLISHARVLSRSDRVFSLANREVRSLRVSPGSAAALRVEYAPTSGNSHTGVVELSISNPTTPFTEVLLSGSTTDASMLVVPNDLDFGAISVGCAARARTVTIYNTATTPATIRSIAIAQPGNRAFAVERLPSPLPNAPLVLPAGASAQFGVRFRTDVISDYAGAVEIIGDFNGAPVRYLVSLHGRGDVNAVQVDQFDQLGRPKVDMLLVVDDSCSMAQEQASLARNFTTFIQFANQQQIDYQIAVTTTDVGGMGAAGRFVPVTGQPTDRIVRPQTQPSPESVFATNVAVGTAGSTNEAGLHAAFLALSNPLVLGHNASFLRPEAVLSLIFVSDEPDHSPSSVDFYLNFFLSIKGFRNTNLFSASSIVGDPAVGCTGASGDALPGTGYLDVSARTGGIFQSICTTDWSRALEDLSRTAFGLKSRFFLSNQPVVQSIDVLVDGVEVPANGPDGQIEWDYDFDTNSVNFAPLSTPEPGAHVRVEYTVECL